MLYFAVQKGYYLYNDIIPESPTQPEGFYPKKYLQTQKILKIPQFIYYLKTQNKLKKPEIKSE